MIRSTRRILCLDWDKRSLRLVLARTGGGAIRLEDAHSHRIPSGVDVEDPQALGPFIAQCLERHRIRHHRAIVDVPRDKAVINRLRLPPTPPAELAAAVRFQAMRELPFSLEEAEIDFVTLATEEGGRATEVLLAAVRRDTLDRLRETVQAAGLTPIRIGLRPYANLVSVTRLPGMHDKRVLFIDAGPAMTEIDVVRGGTLAFSRAAGVSVPFVGGELVTDESRISSKAELSEVELSDEAAATTVDELLVEITRTLQAYRAAESNAVIEQIVIAGSTGLEHDLLEAVEEKFGLPTTLFDPTLALGVGEQDAAKLRAFSAVLGLAWGVSREGLLELDFLNPKRPLPPRLTLKRRLRVGGIAAGVLLVGAVAGLAADRIQRGRELDALQKGNAELAAKVLAAADVQIRTLEAEDWREETRLSLWLNHLLDLSTSAVEPGRKMLVTSLSCDVAKSLITLKLACSDLDVATRFADALRAVEQSGKRVYDVEMGTWQVGRTVDPRFQGTVDVRVVLRELARHQIGAKERQRAREVLKDVN